jgi:hypothetical protein
MNHLTDIELLTRIEMTRTAIAEMDANRVVLETDFARYLDELTDRYHPLVNDPDNRYRLSDLVETTRSAIGETNMNLESLGQDLNRYLDELMRRKKKDDPMERYTGKLERIYNFILDFTCSAMPKKTASYRFVSVPAYRSPEGAPRTDPLEYQIDEENDVHMTVTFYVSTDELHYFITSWWQRKFKNLAYVGFYPTK